MSKNIIPGRLRFLALVVGSAVLAVSALLVVISPGSARPAQQETTPTPEITPVITQTVEITSTLRPCQECHLDIAAIWESSPHALAHDNPDFLTIWDDLGRVSECLDCHPGGGDLTSGTAVSEGVGCLACHYYLDGSHPPDPVAVRVSAEDCGLCHTQTLAGWRSSGHQIERVNCIDCHDPHWQTLRFENSDDLCLDCHQIEDLSTDDHHSSHTAEEAACIDCHMTVIPGDREGHEYTDHSFSVNVDTCNECHLRLDISTMEDITGTLSITLTQVVSESPIPSNNVATGSRSETDAAPRKLRPDGFIIVGGLFGLAAGVIASPWIKSKLSQLGQNKQPAAPMVEDAVEGKSQVESGAGDDQNV